MAQFRYQATIEELEYYVSREINTSQKIIELATVTYLNKGVSLLIINTTQKGPVRR
jgi:fructose-1-phosphate kinase PfkB-like protein